MAYGIKGSFGLQASGGTSIPEWGTGIFLADGTEGVRVHCTVDGEPAVAVFSGGLWGIVAPSSTAQAYAAANPMPPGAVATAWLTTTSYLTLEGSDVETGGLNPGRAHALILLDPNLPPQVGWSRVRLGAFRNNETEAPYTDIQVALCNGGAANAPTLNGGAVTWVQATGLQAPPAPAGGVPGAGPICAFLDIPSQIGARGLAIRTKRGVGDWTYHNAGTDASYYPTGMGVPYAQDGDPTLTSNVGWGESFGAFPAIYVEYELTSSIVRLDLYGDSQPQGFVENDKGGKGPLGHCHDIWLASGDHPLISVVNLCQEGATTAQISGRMRAFAPIFGTKCALRQTQSTNDDPGYADVIEATVLASRATFDSDAAWLEGQGIGLIPLAGPGKSGWAAGAYGRFRSFYTLDNWSTTYPRTLDVVDGACTDPTDNGAPYPSMTIDGAHLNPVGQLAWATPLAPAIVAVLEGEGYVL